MKSKKIKNGGQWLGGRCAMELMAIMVLGAFCSDDPSLSPRGQAL
jgi:hypothetical protein